jgi:hypothetical protein
VATGIWYLVFGIWYVHLAFAEEVSATTNTKYQLPNTGFHRPHCLSRNASSQKPEASG